MLGLAPVLLAAGLAAGRTPTAPPTGVRTVHVTIHFSSFDPGRIEAVPGETVRFVIENTDPIDHEFILGDDRAQQIHELGTEAVHPPKPGEGLGAGRHHGDDDLRLRRSRGAHVRVPPAGALRIRDARQRDGGLSTLREPRAAMPTQPRCLTGVLWPAWLEDQPTSGSLLARARIGRDPPHVP